METTYFQTYVRIITEIESEAAQVIRQLFYTKWQQISGKPWTNTVNQGVEFIKDAGRKVWTCGDPRQKMLIQNGDAELWNFMIITDVLTKVDFGNAALSVEERVQIEELKMFFKNVRFGEVPVLEFQSLIQKAKNLRKRFKIIPKYAEPCKEDFTNNFIQLVLEGKNHCKRKKYNEAVKVFTECIFVENLSSNLRGVSYCNRAYCYLNLGNAKQALEDAKRAVQLCPTWFRAYYRLASAYNGTFSYVKSLLYLKVAALLDEKNYGKADVDKLTEQTNKCRNEEAAEKNDYTYRQRNAAFEACIDLIRTSIQYTQELSLPIPGNEVLYVMTVFSSDHGILNCDEAIPLFDKIVTCGRCPAASYYLGLMYCFELGYELNYSQAFKYFSHASMQGVAKNGKVEFGVSESEYAIGTIYKKGLGVVPNLEEAIRWFKKSANNGNSLAAYTLKCLYSKGKGVEVGKVIDFNVPVDKEFDERIAFFNNLCRGNLYAALVHYRSCFTLLELLLSKEFLTDVKNTIERISKMQEIDR